MYDFLKKKYGQNFLIDKNILKKINNINTQKNLNIIEIGPGDGRLTDYILETKPKKLTLIEIDSDLIPILESKYGENRSINIINENILKYDLDKKFDLIISNLPYNISSQILVKICLLRDLPNDLILMFQKEFAQRLLEIKLNSLNSLVKCFFEIKQNFDVKNTCFRPIPKVNSTVLHFSKKTKPLLNFEEISKFIDFKRQLFSHKRKSLGHVLKKYKFDSRDIDLSARAESISLDILLKIFKQINP
jgi:16S rRNA (adenine1518-N6/adenine1519-N6)-dimethyltransferase